MQPESLVGFIAGQSQVLIVPRTIVDKIQARHASDIAHLERLRELLDGWEPVGLSPSGTGRLELYGQIDGVWHTVVALANEVTPYSVLVTFHRVYARKVLSRERSGRLRRR
jgi:hypothetical protein